MGHTTSRVGVREMRQNLSVYLERVARGETLEVTDRGRPVALLTPLPAVPSRLGQLIATGRARPGKGDVAALALPTTATRLDLSSALRDSRRRSSR